MGTHLCKSHQLSKGLGLREEAGAQIVLWGQMLCLQHQTNVKNIVWGISYRQPLTEWNKLLLIEQDSLCFKKDKKNKEGA